MKRVTTPLIVFLSILLNACVTTPASQVEARPSPEAVTELPSSPVIQNESILEYTGKFLALPAANQKEEVARVHARLAMNKQDLNDRTKLAAIYTLSDVSEIRDSAKAQVLLEELSRERDPDLERATLVKILRGFIVEHNKIARENNRLGQKVADEQKRTEALQQKLEELKQIEKNLVDRKVMDK